MTEFTMKGGAELVAKRYRAERRFKALGLASLAVTGLFLGFLIVDIMTKGFPAFFEHTVKMDVMIDPAKIDANAIAKGDFQGLAKDALREAFPGVSDRSGRKQLAAVLSSGAGDALRGMVSADPKLIGTKVSVPLLLSGDADLYLKGYQAALTKNAGAADLTISEDGDGYLLTTSAPLAAGQIVRANGGALKVSSAGDGSAKAEVIEKPGSVETAPAGQWDIASFSTKESDRRSSDREILWLEQLKDKGQISKGFAWRFFSSGDSREPELAGIRGALVGSLLVIAVTLSICLPIGVGAALYLEEFASKNRFTDLIEVNINNLAAVPSIIFGLLGLAVFLSFFGLPRSAPFGGRACAGAPGAADDHHRLTRRLPLRAAIDQGSRAWRRRFASAGGVPPRSAAGGAWHSDRHDPWHRPSFWRIRAAFDDRHDRLHRRCAEGLHGCGNRHAGADFPLVRSSRDRVPV